MRASTKTLLAATVLAIGVTTATGAGFQTPIVVDTPGGPFRLTVAHLDADQLADVITADPTDNTITVFRSTGSGTFADAVQMDAGAGAPYVITLDADGDAFPDLVATGGPVTVFLDDQVSPDGFVATPLSVSGPSGCVTGDFDGQPGDDIIVIRNDGGVEVLLNDGAGNFTSGGTFVVGGQTTPLPTWLQAADMDDDGDLDVVATASAADRAYIMANDGSANFEPRSSISTGGSPWGLALADFDGDDTIDVATANRGIANNKYSISLSLNDGVGRLAAPSTIELDAMPVDITAVDLDDDGNVDLVAANPGGGFSVLPNTGNATFLPATARATGVLSTVHNVGAGDIDGDGIPDLAFPGFLGNDMGIVLGSDAPPPAPLTITPSVLTTRGPHQLTIAGTGFSLFADVSVDDFDVSSIAISSDTEASAIVNADGPTGSGTRTVIVTNPDGQQAFGTVELRSIDLEVTKGLIKDAAKPGRDKIALTGIADHNGLANPSGFTPTLSSVSVVVSDATGEVYRLDIPASDPGWKVNRRGAFKWKGSNGRERLQLTFDPNNERFSLKARRLELGAAPDADLTVVFETTHSVGTNRGVDEATWQRARGNKLRR